MNKLTKKMALSAAVDMLRKGTIDITDYSREEIADKLESMISLLDKKDAAPRKLTEQQKKNEVIKTAILDFLSANAENGYTVSDLIAQVPECNGDTTQHISALVRALDLDKMVQKYVEKRHTYVKIAA